MSSDSPKPPTSSQSNVPNLFKLILWTRFLSAIAVVSSLAATLLMLIIGADNTLKAFGVFFGEHPEASNTLEAGEKATLLLLESLDNFLVGLAFVYFAYGIYSLFIPLNRNQKNANQPAAQSNGMPAWLKVSSIASLKKTLLEILVVLLSVTFVKWLFEYSEINALEWDVVIFPISIVAIALSLKLMNLGDE